MSETMDNTQDLPTALENMRKSRDEFKAQVATQKAMLETQGRYIEDQRELIGKLIDAVCALSKAVKR